jgi:valyl-tRNA synthetase
MIKARTTREVDDDLAATLAHVLGETLALCHPFIPFVTEELWEHVPGTTGLLAGGHYPRTAPTLVDPAAETQVDDLIAAVTALRAWRETTDLPPKTVLPARLPASYAAVAPLVARLARLELDGATDGEASASVPVPGGAVEIFAADLVDPEAEAAKLAARRKDLASEIKRAEGKLSNQGFIAKAPEALVEAERAKLERLRSDLAELA